MAQGKQYTPTEDQRKTVRGMAGYGMPHDDIATILDIDPKTLRKYFDRELRRGSIEATTKVAQSLFNMATAEKNVAAAIFWMKVRAGWTEKQSVQLDVSGTLNVESLDDTQLASAARRELAAFLAAGNKGNAKTKHKEQLN